MDTGVKAKAVALALVALAGCSKSTTINQNSGNAAGASGAGQGGGAGSGGAQAGAAGDAAAGAGGGLAPCPDEVAPAGKLGRPMARVQRADGACLWIDTHEVTWEEFGEFVPQAASEAVAAECAGHAVDAPDEGCAGPLGAADARAKLPVSCVDWCDALAFCRWEGKGLCRGEQYTVTAADPARSAWFAACAAGDGRAYPYGAAYDGVLCNGKESGKKMPTEAGSMDGCATPAGVEDLSGNVAEWTDECNGGVGLGTVCLTRGGSYDDGAASLGCDQARPFARSTALATVGFRCCAE